MYSLDEIKARISLIELAEEAGARFCPSGSSLISHCPLPLHAGDRSSRAFSVYDHGSRWKCHSSCPPDANGGDVITFYMLWRGVDFKTAIAVLSERCGLERHERTGGGNDTRMVIQPKKEIHVPPGEAWQKRANQFILFCEDNLNQPEGTGARDYLERERGLWEETWTKFRLGYNPRLIYDDPTRWGLNGKKIWLPRGITIPGLCNDLPSYVKIRRALPGSELEKYIGPWNADEGLPEVKFGGPRGGKSLLFGHQLFEFLPALILVEGEWDAMLTWQWCQDFCDVGTLGGAKSKISEANLELLIRYPIILVVYDDDAAGEQARAQMALLSQQGERLKVIPPPPAHDITDFWKLGGNIRAWVAMHVADALDSLLGRISSGSPAVERWRRISTWARHEGKDHGTKTISVEVALKRAA